MAGIQEGASKKSLLLLQPMKLGAYRGTLPAPLNTAWIIDDRILRGLVKGSAIESIILVALSSPMKP
jgi:hypothetical protein